MVERGTHDDLVAAHGRYWEIYRKQLGLKPAAHRVLTTRKEDHHGKTQYVPRG